MQTKSGLCVDIPSTALGFGESRKLNLDAVDTIDAVDKEDQDEDKGNLSDFQACFWEGNVFQRTFMPYCSFAMRGLSEMKVKSLRRHVKGSGMMRARNMTISSTRRRKTCVKNKSKHVGSMIGVPAGPGRRVQRWDAGGGRHWR